MTARNIRDRRHARDAAALVGRPMIDEVPPDNEKGAPAKGASLKSIAAGSGDTGTDTPDVAIPQDLPSIAAEVRALHTAAEDHFRTTLSYARRAGELLTTAK